VASAVGGLTTLVDHGETGFLVERGETGLFAGYVQRILTEPALAQRMAVRAAARALGYSWREAAERLAALHEELAAGHLVQC
jgi:glycosyltransferase involved in cell wall biosynthesis